VLPQHTPFVSANVVRLPGTSVRSRTNPVEISCAAGVRRTVRLSCARPSSEQPRETPYFLELQSPCDFKKFDSVRETALSACSKAAKVCIGPMTEMRKSCSGRPRRFSGLCGSTQVVNVEVINVVPSVHGGDEALGVCIGAGRQFLQTIRAGQPQKSPLRLDGRGSGPGRPHRPVIDATGKK